MTGIRSTFAPDHSSGKPDAQKPRDGAAPEVRFQPMNGLRHRRAIKMGNAKHAAAIGAVSCKAIREISGHNDIEIGPRNGRKVRCYFSEFSR